MTYFKKGSSNALCDSCGFEFKREELRKRWDGMYVCAQDWETRHPLDFLRAKGEKAPLPWTRPDDTVSYTTTYTVIGSGTTNLTAANITDNEYLIVVNFNAGSLDYTYNLPVKSSLPAFYKVTFYRKDSQSTSTMTIGATSPDTLVGTATVAVNTFADFIITPTGWKRAEV